MLFLNLAALFKENPPLKQLCLMVSVLVMLLPDHTEIAPPEVANAITNGCGVINMHFCIQSGCYYNAHIVKVGEPRPSITANVIPKTIDIWYRTGYLSGETLTLRSLDSVKCAQKNLSDSSGMGYLLVACIPAIVLSIFIVVMLMGLDSSSQPYIFTQKIDTNEDDFEMNEVGPAAIDTSSDDDDDDEIDHREFTIND
jgi:hypothetical protein